MCSASAGAIDHTAGAAWGGAALCTAGGAAVTGWAAQTQGGAGEHHLC